MRSDCYDLRVTDYGGNLLPLWIETGTNACNTATTQIWVKVPSVPTPNNVLLIYYGNSTVTSGTNGHGPSSAGAGKEVFEFFDDFDTMDSSKWTLTGSPTVAGGVTALTNGQTLVSSALVTSSSGLGRIITRVKQAATTQTAGKIGFYNSNDAATIGFGNLEEKLSQIVPSNIISHHKLEETTSTDANQFKASGYLDTGKLSQAVSMYGNAAGTTGSTLTFNRGAQISGNNYEKINTNQGTISMWIKPNWDGNDSTLKVFYLSDSNSYIRLHKAGTNLQFQLYDLGAGNLKTAQISLSSWASGTWYYVTARWDVDNPVSGSNNMEIYINGSTSGATNNTTAFTNVIYPGVNNSIGSRIDGTQSAQALIDDFAIFDRVLTTTEITNIYNSGTGREAGYVADASLKFYAKMDGSGTLSPVTYNGGASASKITATSSELTGGINLASNGNFEAATGGTPTNWICETATCADASTADILFDTRTQKITATAQYGRIRRDNITVAEGSTYTISFWAKNTGSVVQYSLSNPTETTYIVNPTSITSSWDRYETVIKIPAGFGTSLRFKLQANSGSAWDAYYIDNFSIVPNLVDNGGMEGTYASGTAPGWTCYLSATCTEEAGAGFFHSGSKAQKIVTVSGSQGMYENVSITADGWYLASIWLRVTSGTVIWGDGAAPVSGTAQTVTAAANGDTWTKYTHVFKAVSSDTTYQFYIQSSSGTFYIDDVSIIPLDNTALSFQAWAPASDAASANNPLSVHGGTSGVASNATGKLNNGYTFDGSTGYLRQKSYLSNLGTLSYGTNALTDTGQTFTSYKTNPATYMIVVTNSDNTTSWGYIGTTSGATIVDVFTTKALSVAGWNGTSPSGKTPVGYEVRKTDYQTTGSFTVGTWANGNLGQVIMSKYASGSSYSWRLRSDGSGHIQVDTNGAVYTSASTFSASTWAFLVFTWDGSTLKSYINGVLDANTTSASVAVDSAAPFIVGADDGGNKYTGSIDSPFVLNTDLTADQVAALYQYHSLATTNNSTISVVNGSATPTNDTNYHTYLMTAGSSSTTVASDNTVFATSSTNLPNEAVNLRLMNSDTTNALTVDWIAVAKQASSAPTVGAPAAEEKGAGPVAYFKFDEGTGTSAKDSSPNGNTGTITGASWQTEDQCISIKCLKFNAGSDKVDAGDTSSLKLDSAGSVGMWIKPTAYPGTGSWKTIFNKGNWSAGRNSYSIYFQESDSLIYFDVNNGTAHQTVAVAYSKTPLNKWSHVSMTWSASTITAYINGLQVGTSARSGTMDTSGYNAQVGSANGTAAFSGFIDDVKIYNYARTAAQIKSDFASRGSLKGSSARLGSKIQDLGSLSNGLVGYWKMEDVSDSSGNSVTLTNNGVTTFTAGKFANASTYNGSSQYLSTATSISGVKTVSFWTNPASTTDNYINLASGVYINSASGTIAATGTTSPTIYVNGVISSTIAASTWSYMTITTDTAITANVFEVGRANSAYAGNGTKIDETRIYNRALSPREVRDLYNWAPGPVGYWNFEEASTGTLNDKSGNGVSGTDTGTLSTSGKFGKARQYNGSTDTTVIADNNSYNDFAYNKDFSVSFWMYNGIGNANGDGIVEKWDGTGGYPYVFRFNSSNGITFARYDGTNNPSIAVSTNVNDGKWHFVSGIKDGSNIKLFIDGVLINTATDITSGTTTNTSGIYLGSRGGTGSWWTGKIDEIKIYNYARTQKQIVEDMNGGHPAGGSPVGSQVGYWKFDEGYGSTVNDSSPQRINGTLSGTVPTWTNSGKFGKALSFNGAGYVSLGNITAYKADSKTISFWANPTTVTGTTPIVSGSSGNWYVGLATSGRMISSHFVSAGSQQVTYSNNSAVTNSTWHQYTYSLDVSGSNVTVYFYVDGKLNSSTTYATGYGSIYGSNFNLGSYDTASLFYTGLLDEVKIYNYALTKDEVQLDFNKGAAIALGTLSDTSGLTGGSSASSSATASYCVPGSTDTCSAPVGEWNFEEGSGASAFDSSGNGNTGTATGTTVVSGKVGKARSLNGSSDYVNAGDPTNGSLDFGTGDFTIESWIKFNAAPTANSIVMKRQDNNTFYMLILDGTGKLYASMRPDATAYAYRVGTTTLTTGRWYHVAAVFDRDLNNGMQTVYVNGVNDNGTGGYDGVNTTTLSNTGSFIIGQGGLLGGSYHNGSVDQVKVFNYARTAAQVAWDYNRGAPIARYKLDECQGATANDASGNGNSGTITIGASGTQTSVGTCTTSGAWFNGVSGKYNSSLNFDGTDDYASIPDPASGILDFGTNNHTHSVWVKTTDVNGGLLGKADAGATAAVLLDVVSGKARFFLRNSSASAVNVSSTTSINDGNWHHIVGVRDGTNISIYVDGKLNSTPTAHGGINTSSAAAQVIGDQTTSSPWPLAGQIDDARIYNYALTASQIKTLYNENSAVRFGPSTGSP